MSTRIPASERTSQKLDELLSQGVADGKARAELLKLAVRKIVEEALEAEVADAVGRGYYENGASFRSSDSATSARASCSPPNCRSASGRRSSQTPQRPPRSSIASSITPRSSPSRARAIDAASLRPRVGPRGRPPDHGARPAGSNFRAS